jgi:uncharacterized OB-fold protein
MADTIVYTETTIFSPPETHVSEAPYQIAIVDLPGGGRHTVRILGEAVRIGDRVVLAEERDGVSFYRKA